MKHLGVLIIKMTGDAVIAVANTAAGNHRRCTICGSLKLENTAKTIGNPITYQVRDMPIIPCLKGDGSTEEHQLLGHRRIESEAASPTPNAERVKLLVSEYSEGTPPVPFLLPIGKAIDALLIYHKNFPKNGSGIFIFTRPASKEERRRCRHPRHPHIVNKEI